MIQERIEIRLNPASAAERNLMTQLEQLGQEYGAKGRFLRERLLRGYELLAAELQGFLAEVEPLAALELSAARYPAKRYRVMKLLLGTALVHSRGQPVVKALTADAAPPASPPLAPLKGAYAEIATLASRLVQIVPSASPEPVCDLASEVELRGEVDQAVEAQVAPQADPVVTPVVGAEVLASAVSLPRPDWSAFAGIAGVKKP